jgi:hypothetical protein
LRSLTFSWTTVSARSRREDSARPASGCCSGFCGAWGARRNALPRRERVAVAKKAWRAAAAARATAVGEAKVTHQAQVALAALNRQFGKDLYLAKFDTACSAFRALKEVPAPEEKPLGATGVLRRGSVAESSKSMRSQCSEPDSRWPAFGLRSPIVRVRLKRVTSGGSLWPGLRSSRDASLNALFATEA